MQIRIHLLLNFFTYSLDNILNNKHEVQNNICDIDKARALCSMNETNTPTQQHITIEEKDITYKGYNKYYDIYIDMAYIITINSYCCDLSKQ